MSRPETFTLRCDRCGFTVRHCCMNPDKYGDHDQFFVLHYTSHRQATLDGNAAGWRLTSLEEVCKACVAKESEQHGPGGTSDD